MPQKNAVTVFYMAEELVVLFFEWLQKEVKPIFIIVFLESLEVEMGPLDVIWKTIDFGIMQNTISIKFTTTHSLGIQAF